MNGRSEKAVRYPGLFLWLIACMVVATTHLLASANGEPERTPDTGDAPAPVVTARRTPVPAWTVPSAHPLLPERFHGVSDELLASPMLHHPDFQQEVRRWIDFWSTGPTEWFPSYLERMTGFQAMVDSSLAERGLPPSFRYLPIIESGYLPTAVSRASAVGLWQFMAPTAKDFGIEVSRFVDDRRDPFVSTRAAGDFLLQLREEFDSWFLALAAYNAGPERIRGILRRHAPDAEPSDALYWALRDALPRETREYVPNLIGAVIVASDPAAYGYAAPTPRPFEFDRIPVFGSVTFEAAARATGSTPDEIARLNPEYLQGATPGLRQVEIRVPPGKGEAFREYFASRAGG